MTQDSFPADWQLARETRMVLPGPAGTIDVLVNGLPAPRAVALLFHPHPLYGGSMDNKVVFTLARACRDSGILAVRFNFRGVGGSAGLHDNGVGELADARVVLEYLRTAMPAMPVVLGGFSFGAAMAAQLAQTEPCTALILAAPPVPRYGLDKIAVIRSPVLLLQGEDDEIVDSEAVFRWFGQLSAPHKTLRQWQQAGHFFHGQLPELKAAVMAFLSARVL